MSFLVHGKIPSTRVNGPGDRAIVHFQSCNLGCPGCWNPETHNPDIKKQISYEDFRNWIFDNAKDGVTFSGGEPMQQAHPLSDLIYELKSRRPELSIGMYTGYTLSELERGEFKTIGISTTNNPGSIYYQEVEPERYNPWFKVKKHLDFAIMGRFNKQKLDKTSALTSSTNQDLVLFSDRYKESDFQQQQIEFTVGAGGLIQITGFPVGMSELLESRDW